MSYECERKGKLFGGCRFQPRYHDLSPKGEVLEHIDLDIRLDADKILTLIRDTIYVGDVCTRCGRFVEAPSDNTEGEE